MEKKAISRSIYWSFVGALLCYGAGWLLLDEHYLVGAVTGYVGWVILKSACKGESLESLKRKQFLEQLSRSEDFGRLAQVDQLLVKDLIDNDNH